MDAAADDEAEYDESEAAFEVAAALEAEAETDAALDDEAENDSALLDAAAREADAALADEVE